MIKILFKLIFFFFLFTNISSADLIKPNSKLKPFEVLTIQLNSLKNTRMLVLNKLGNLHILITKKLQDL